jgi:membrane associated rhomboid family serine protease
LEHQAPKFLDYLKFRKGYVIVPSLFYINLLFYLVISVIDMNFLFPRQDTIIKFGANANFLTLDGQWWRMITCMFLHYGPLHLFSNMYALTRMGYVLENFIGAKRLLAAYFFTGITASIVSTWWHSLSVGVGASGAIFGLFGLFLALVTTEFVAKESRWPLVKNIGITILINLAIGTQLNIDNSAHIGGLTGGIMAGYIIYGIYKLQLAHGKRVLAFCLTMLVLSAAVIIFLLPMISREPVKIRSLMSGLDELNQQHYNDSVRPKGIPNYKMLANKWQSLAVNCDSVYKNTSDRKLKESIDEMCTYIKLRQIQSELLVDSANAGNAGQLKITETKLREYLLQENE